jgi:hypothetical protein
MEKIRWHADSLMLNTQIIKRFKASTDSLHFPLPYTMKTTHKTLTKLLGLAFASAVGSSLFGATIILDTNSYSDVLRGGEFTAITSPTLSTASYSSKAIVTAADGTGFETFCMEYNQEFYPRATYDYTISNVVMGGDTGIPGTGDPLSKGTAYLYSQFASGTLAGYNYSTTGSVRAASALDLQLAFWYLEDETSLTQFIADNPAYASGPYNYSTNVFVAAVVSQFGSLAAAKADASYGYDGVYALNLTSNGGATDNQTQLYYRVPDNGATLALLGVSLLGLVGFRRRFAK